MDMDRHPCARPVPPHRTIHYQSLDEFLGHLNSQKPAIQFTMEKEEDGKIAFLDVLVEKKGTLAATSIFRKKTHTDRYMNYDSHHHARIKSSIIKCLGTRAKNVCRATKMIEERNHLKQLFQANGYPAQMVNRTLRNCPHSPTRTEEQEQTTPKCGKDVTIHYTLPLCFCFSLYTYIYF